MSIMGRRRQSVAARKKKQLAAAAAAKEPAKAVSPNANAQTKATVNKQKQ